MFTRKIEGSDAQVGGGEAFARLVEARAKAEGRGAKSFRRRVDVCWRRRSSGRRKPGRAESSWMRRLRTKMR